MMDRILNIEEINYSSSLSEESLKKRIEDLFAQSTLQLVGKLTNEHEFTAYDKLAVIGWNMPGLKRKSAYLKGKITPEKGGTLVKLKTNPNSVLPLFAILATFLGIVITTITLLNAQYNSFVLIFGFILIALGLVYYPMSTFLRNRLRNKIVNHLDLKRA